MNERAKHSGVIKGVAFDLYGTLLRYGKMDKAWNAWANCFYGVLKDYGLQEDFLSFQQGCDGFFSRMPSIRPDTEFTIYEYAMNTHALGYGIQLPYDVLAQLAMDSCEVWQNYIHPDPCALTVLKQLKDRGLSIALLTNFDHTPHIYSTLAKLVWGDFFSAVVVSAETGTRKPHPQIFEILANKMKIPPQHLVYLGDDPNKDIVGAKNAGFLPILIKRGKGLNRMHTDYRVDGMAKAEKTIDLEHLQIKKLEELPELLDQIQS